MKSKARRRIHLYLAVFFAVQIPVAIAFQLFWPEMFDKVWIQYVIFLSLYAIVSTHWAGFSAESPLD